ncbi:PHP domain-containing protein, partial [Lacticaseibacillus paracasei]
SACSNFGIGSIAITDIDSMSGAVNFSTAADKAGIKPLLGTKLLIAGEGYVTAIAKNLSGWGELCSLVSQSCISTVTFDELAEKKNIIVIS